MEETGLFSQLLIMLYKMGQKFVEFGNNTVKVLSMSMQDAIDYFNGMNIPDILKQGLSVLTSAMGSILGVNTPIWEILLFECIGIFIIVTLIKWILGAIPVL